MCKIAQFFAIFILLLLIQSCLISKKHIVIKPAKKKNIKRLDSSKKRFLKRKVAIARFSNESSYGRGLFFSKKNKPLENKAIDILSEKLAATNKFLLIERQNTSDINREKKIKEMEDNEYDKESKKISLNKVPADYLIIGSISEFGKKIYGKQGLLTRTKRQTAYAEVNVRLVDILTSEIIYSAKGRGEVFSEVESFLGIGEKIEYDSFLGEKAISAAISKLVSNIVEHFQDKPWRAYILGRYGEEYILSGGKSQGINIGDIFGVYERGQKIKNPQTSIFLELPGKFVGKIKVDSLLGNVVKNEISLCSIVSGNIASNNFHDLYVQEF